MTLAASLVSELRRRAGLSQAMLADKADMSQSAVSDYERGRKEPGVGTLARLVSAAGLELMVEFIDPPAVDPATPTLARIRGHRREVLAACTRHGASRPRVFGSVARGSAGPTSDIDLLVDLEEGRTYFDVAELHDELVEILGHPVDVLTAGAVRGRLADVARTAIAL